MAKVKFAQRLMRGFFTGLLGGLGGGLGLLFLCEAVNRIAGSTVLDPIAFLLLGVGMGILAGFSIEQSKEMEEQ